ncbi:MAG: agmatine deiminase family protein [Pseudomonadota bacterium]
MAHGKARPVFSAPAEEAPHSATWMAWPHSREIYTDTGYFEEVKLHLSRLANAIGHFEPVFMAARDEDFSEIKTLCPAGVFPVAIPTNDMWMRDTGPVFVTSRAGQLAAIDFNFNGWGNKQQPRANDAAVARNVCEHLNIKRLATSLVGEGGGLEYDGQGTLLLTDSCWLNDNRNPDVSKAAMTAELQRLLGVEKVIWLPGVKGQDITDGHIDGALRLVRPGLVMTSGFAGDDTLWGDVLRESREILTRETDARGRPFTLVDIPGALAPSNTSEALFTSYANYYVANGAVFTPRFGDLRADNLAQKRLAELFPGRQVVPLDIDRIYENGGGIHCVTQQQPAV